MLQHLLISAVWDGGTQLGQPGTHLLAHQLFPLIKKEAHHPIWASVSLQIEAVLAAPPSGDGGIPRGLR